MGPSRAGYGWVARASAHRASSGQISLLCEGKDVWSWFPAAETTSQAAVPTEPEAAQSILGHMASLGLGELGMLFDPEPRGIGAEVCSPSPVSLCRMQLLEARFVSFRSFALGGFLPSWLWGGC